MKLTLKISIEKVGTGQLGETISTPIPKIVKKICHSLIGKFPSDDETVQHGRSMGFYKSEVMFGKELALNTRIKTPRPFAELDEDNNTLIGRFNGQTR